MMKQVRFIFILFIASLFAVNGFAQSLDLNAKMPTDPDVKIGKLDNGLVYYIRKNAKPENRVEMKLAINAGALYETDAQQGLAHFCEHMCFNGSKNFEKNELINFLEKMGVRFGADLNAYTAFDETVYMLQLPTDNKELVDKGYLVLEDWAHNVTFANEEIDKERGVIEEEWRLGLGADDRMRKASFPIIFKDSRYAERLPIGKIDVIRNFPYEEIKKFYKDWYRPNLMAIIVVGDIDVAEAEQKIKDHFAHIQNPANQKERIQYEVPDNKEPLVSIATDKEATSNTVMFFYKHKREIYETVADYKVMLMHSLYNGMFGQRLHEIGQKADAPFMFGYSAYTQYLARNLDVYLSYAGAKENQIDESLEVLLLENERVKQFGFTATELERQKKEILSHYEKMAKEADKTPSKRFADEYKNNFLKQEPIPGIANELKYAQELLPTITVEDINALAKKWITDHNLVIAINAPDKEGVEVPTKEEVLEIIKNAKTVKVTAYEDVVNDEPLLAKLPTATKVVNKVANEKIGFTELTFENGIQVILKETDFKNDEILLSAYSPGGMSLYPDADFVSAAFASTIIEQSGVGNFDNIALDKKLAGKVVGIAPSISELTEGLSGSSTPADFETLLQLNYLYFTAPRKDKETFDAFMSKMRNQMKFISGSPQYAFTDTLYKIISSNSPRVMAMPSEKQMESVNLDVLYKIYQERFADASDFKFFFVGNFKTDEIIPLLETYIGGLPVINRKETWKDVSPKFPEGKTEVTINKGVDEKSMVAIVMHGDFDWNLKNRLEADAMMEILSLRLRESMREDEGGVYTFSARISIEKLPASEYSVNFSFGCSPKNVKKLTKIIFKEIANLQKNGPKEEDLAKIKEMFLRERETNLTKNNYWLYKLQYSYYRGDDINQIYDFNSIIENMTLEDVKKAANTSLTSDKYVKVVLMPEKK